MLFDIEGSVVLGKSIDLKASHLKAIAQALTDSTGGLTHREIDYLLDQFRMEPQAREFVKWERVFNGFASSVNRTQNTRGVFWFIKEAAKPERFTNHPEDFEPFRQSVNTPLALIGVSVDEAGEFQFSTRARTLSEAERRAKSLRVDLLSRGVHPEVLKYCKAELLVDDYFHAVQEATKSIAAKLRSRTGLTDDGGFLVDQVFGGETPLLTINQFQTKSQKDEQKGFCNLLKGIFGMFRNPTAHEARISWHMSKEDAEDLLSMVSLAHRRIDKATMSPRL